jgi:hypothetical protein
LPAPKGNKYAKGCKTSGRPALYKTVEDLELRIDEYFNDCPDKRTVYTKTGTAVQIPCPTITGLSLFLGFCSRSSMYEYENEHKEFSDTIKKARSKMEVIYEQLLQDGNSGAIFALKNFGWKDKQEIEHSGQIIWHEEKTYEK